MAPIDDYSNTFIDFLESIGMDEDNYYDALDEDAKSALIAKYADYLTNELLTAVIAPYLSSSLDPNSVRSIQLDPIESGGGEITVILRFSSNQALSDLNSDILEASEETSFPIVCYDLTSEERQVYEDGEYDTGSFSTPDSLDYAESCRQLERLLAESLKDEDYSFVEIPTELTRKVIRDMKKYEISCMKSNSTSPGLWLSDEDYKSVTPYIESISADDGEDFHQLSAGDGKKVIHFNYDGTGDDGDEVWFYFEATIKMDLDENPDFRNALENSENCIFVNLGFNLDGEELEDAWERTEDIEVELYEV